MTKEPCEEYVNMDQPSVSRMVYIETPSFNIWESAFMSLTLLLMGIMINIF